MGVQGIFAFVAAALLLCADPVSSGGEQSLAAQLEPELDAERYEVVAASPVPAGHGIGSHYGWRTSTRTGRRTFHAGADFLVARGTPVFAARGGVVEVVATNRRGWSRFAGYGNAVVVRHPELGRWSFYAHLGSVDVEEGQTVSAGQRLGVVGNTTNGRFPRMVPHLHFEVRRARRDGASPFPGPYRRHNVNPEQWLASLGLDLDRDHECAHSDEAPLLVVRERGTEVVTVATAEVGVGRF